MDPLALFWPEVDAHATRNAGTVSWYDSSAACSYMRLDFNATKTGISETSYEVLDLPKPNPLSFTRAPKLPGVEHELRIILGPPQISENMPIPFSSSTTTQLFKELRFHPASQFSYYLGPCLTYTTFNSISSFSFLIYNGPWTLSLFTSTNHETHVTTTLMHNASNEILTAITSTLSNSDTRPFALHPAHIPVLLLSIIGYNIASSSDTLSTRTSVLLRKLGHWSTEGEVESGLDVEADAEEALIIQEDSVMYILRIEGCQAWSKSLKEIIAKMKVERDERLEKADGKLDKSVEASLEEIERCVLEKLEMTMQCYQATARQLQRSLAWSKSVQDWLQVRNAATANKLNTQIALESKRDSSAMKAIAVLTMIFLPGTFFATLFSLPFFSWTSSSDSLTSIVHPRFWIYWVITFPSTVLVLCAWRTWYKLEEWRRENGKNSLIADLRSSFWPSRRKVKGKKVADEEFGVKEA